MGRNKKYNRDEVLREAMNTFWRLGFEGTSMKELMHATGLNKFSLYSEFKDKEDIFHESLRLYLIDGVNYYDQSLNKKPLGVHNIKAYFRDMNFENDYHGCFYVRALTDIYATPEKSYKMAKGFTKKVEGFFLKNIKASIKKKEFSSKVEPAALAQYLTASDLGMAVFGINRKKSKQLSQLADLILLSLK